jgi:hypothetical protein
MNTPARGIRASDLEREQIAKLVETAAGDGRLTPEEAGERLAEVSAARYRDDLQRLVADLPVAASAALPVRPPVHALWLIGGLIRTAALAGLLLLVWRFASWPMWLFGAIVFFAVARARFRWRTRRSRWFMRHGPGWVAVVR